jgi:hypothetical protein
LRCRDILDGSSHFVSASEDESPFHHWGPEVDCARAGGGVEEVLECGHGELMCCCVAVVVVVVVVVAVGMLSSVVSATSVLVLHSSLITHHSPAAASLPQTWFSVFQFNISSLPFCSNFFPSGNLKSQISALRSPLVAC